MQKKMYKGISLSLLAAIFWGVSGTSGQYLFESKHINVEWLITIRLLISGFILLLFTHFIHNDNIFKIWLKRKDIFHLLAFSIFGMVTVQYTYFAAIKHSNAATATVLQYCAPILIAVFLAIRYQKMPGYKEIAAIILAVIGTFTLVTHGKVGTLAVSTKALLFGISSAISLAIYTLQPSYLLSRHKPAVVIGWGMLCGGIVFSFVKAPWNSEGSFELTTYLNLVFIIFFGTLLAFTFYLHSVKIIGGQKASLLASAEPLAATLLAVYWLKIPFSIMDIIGSVCIICTVFLLVKPEHDTK